MKLFCIYDKKTGEYSSISISPNIATFNRMVSREVNAGNPNNLLCTNAADFDVYCVGEFDQKTAKIDSKVEFMCNCGDLREVSNG